MPPHGGWNEVVALLAVVSRAGVKAGLRLHGLWIDPIPQLPWRKSQQALDRSSDASRDGHSENRRAGRPCLPQEQSGQPAGDKRRRGESPALQVLSGKATPEECARTNQAAELSSPGCHTRGVASYQERSGEACPPALAAYFPFH